MSAVDELLGRRRTWIVLGAILGAIAGSPIVSGSELGLIVFIGVILVFTVIEQRFLARGEGMHWSLLLAYLIPWFASYLLFTFVLTA